uniref:DENN/MADD domain containing 6Aa n=1 Tax=Sparus aurata TaxID=8175 RepID=A0A671XVB3_SPAAU
MGVVIKVRIPTCYDKPGTSQLVQSGQSDSQVSIVLPTIHEVDLFRCFYPVFFHIQMLWELVLLGEALVVMAPSPAESSDTVLALVSCISPLRYCSDFRPYFTIHDSEFKEYTTRTQAPPSVILGVTNPFFAKTLQHWPHIIRIGDMKQAGEMAKQMKVKKLKNLKTLDSKPGVYTAYKPYLNKDEEIIKQLQKMHSEVETVDLVLKLKDKLNQAEKEQLPVRPGTVAKLRAHIEAVILALPEDLQGILHKPSTP